MTTPVNFRVKNGLTVANGVAVTQGNVTISNGTLVIGATAINATSISGAADNAYANGVNYADGKAADAYGNAVAVATGSSTNAYSNAVTFAANATNLTTGTLSLNRLPATVNVALALNVSNTVSLETGNVSVTNGNDIGSFTSSYISFTDSLTESTNTYYAAISHDKLITEKTYSVANVIYADYGEISRTGMFAVVGIDTTNSSIYVRGVTVNTSVISIGNTSVFSAINSTAFVGNGALLTSINATTVGGNSASNLRTYTETYASNATNLASGTVNSARLPAANATVAGATILVDSVSNTSTTAAASAASVKTAYDAAITANTNAASALANASTAYTNAINISANATNLTSGTVNIARIPTVDAVNNTSISYVASANSVKTAYDAATNAYSNAVSYTDGAISAANVSGAAATAYTNAITIAANATNLTSGTVNIARIPTVDAVNNTSITLIPVANNVKTAYDAAIAANTLANTAATSASAAYTNAIAIAANATNLTSGTVNSARLPAGNSTISGAVLLVDSVSNTSTTAAASAASVKSAYDTAITANTNANTALTAAGAAYTNAVSYTDTKIGTANTAMAANAAAAYTNAVSYVDGKIATANSAITGNAATAYSNSVSYTDTKIGTANTAMVANAAAAYSNAVTYTDTKIGTANTAMAANAAAAYTNAVSYTDTKIGTANTAMAANAAAAYSNAVTYTDTKIGTANTAMAANAAAAYSNAVTYVDGKIGTANTAMAANAAAAYTNAVAYTDTVIGTANTAMAANAATAYTNAVSYTDTKIGTANTAMAANADAAYTNAIVFAANASNANNGTLAEARLPFRMNQNLRTSDSPTFANGAFTGSVSVGGDLTITGNLISTNIESFAVSDPLIKLGVNNASDVLWGGFTFHYSGSGNTTNHAGLVRNPASKEFILMSTFGDETAVANNNTINIADASFSYANLTVNLLKAGNATVFSTINATSFSGAANTALTANNSTNLGGQAAAYYTNATNISTGTVNANRLPSLYLGTTTIQRTSEGQAVSGITTLATGNTTITGFANVTGNLTATNPIFNNIKHGYSTTATAAGTTSLTSSSNYLQFFTGTTTQIVTLPAPQTMTLGQGFLIVNNSTGSLEVRAANAATVATVLPGTALLCVSIDLTAGNGAAGWSAEIVGFSTATGTGSVVLSVSPTFTGTLNAGVLAVGNTTTTGFANVTGTIQGGSSLTIAGAASGITTLAAGNTTISGFANVISGLSLSNGTSNFITWSTAGVEGPSINTRSPGTKLLLYPALSVSQTDYAMGISAATMWSSVPSNEDSFKFKWFGADIDVASISGVGNFRTIGYANVGGAIQGGSSLTIAGAASGITTLAAGNTTITGNLSVTSVGSFDRVTTANNGSGTNIAIGDDAWFGDVNTADTVRIAGQQSANNGYIVFGNADNTVKLGRAGTGALTWNGAFSVTGGLTTLSANLVMANNAITRPTLAGYTEHEVANTSTTGSYSLDCGAANFFDLTLTGNTTIAPTNVPPSTRMWAGTLVAKQDATGGRTITWPSGSKYPGGVAPPATTTANAIDIWSLMTYDGGTSWIVSLTVKGAA